jgi:hypothetical protein
MTARELNGFTCGRRALQLTIAACAAALVSSGVRTVGQSFEFTSVASIAGPIDQIEVHGRYGYLSANEVFSIVDLSNPEAPSRVGTYKFPEKIWAVRIIDRLAYVAVDFFGLGILDLTDLTKPTLRGSLKTPGQAKGIALVGKIALLTDHMSGVDVVDTSNIASPALLGSVFLDGYARDVASAGSFAYAVDSPTGLYVFDLSKPIDSSKEEPLEALSRQQSVVDSRAIEVAPAPRKDGVHLAVMTGGPALQVYDVANPRSPKKLASFSMPGGTRRAALVDDLVYVACGTEGLQVVDLAAPSKPRIIATYKTPMPARDVAVEGSLVFVSMGKLAIRYQGDGEVLILRQRR